MTWFPSYTNCSSPGGYYGTPAGALALLGVIGSIGAILAAVAGAWVSGVDVFMAMACLAGITFCTWWLNIRLICLGGDRSAIGAIFHLERPGKSGAPFAFGDYDTDYSFNLLLWPFMPSDKLPDSFVAEQWSTSAEADLAAAWPTLTGVAPVPWATVQTQVEKIIPQQTMASLGLTFTGQSASGSDQNFLLHCEIEGRGMLDLRTLLWVLFGVFTALAAISAIPVVGWAISLFLAILAFFAFLFGGSLIQDETASPPGGDWGGSFNPYDVDNSDADVDLAYVDGRWVYDSLHSGWNELHPLHFMIKIGQAKQWELGNGIWPPNLADQQARLDKQFAANNMPGAVGPPLEPQNQWKLHPLLDGCGSPANYPDPDPGEVIK